ncbi:unnamed protein product [marine sediment metagenome]|uniref:Carboxymuconolactone decarboxylase-like domain-containing protein n=1 Tax=marine sediment metagenome TaxID=412755 RepID=X1MNL9_9ZZZZ
MAIIKALKKDQVEEAARGVYEKFEKETGKVPEWVKVMAHNPKVVKEFTELFKVIMDEGYIEPLLRWKIAHVVSHSLKCPFCVDVTGKMLKTMGASDEVLEKIKGGKDLPEEEKEVLSLVKEVTLKATCNPELFERLRKKFSEEELVEIVSIIGLFNYINRFNNTFCILPE